MFFSIIIPVYNVEQYLHECVNSIVNQTFKDFELILVDNGSTDTSGRICDDYASKYNNVRVKHLMPNVGASGARNEGQLMATGDYILFVDSDDYYINESVLDKLYQKAVNNPDVILFKFVEFSEKTGILGDCSFDFNIQSEGRSVSQICSDLIDRNAYYNSAWSKAIKRQLLIDNDISFTLGLSVEDNEWYYHVVMRLKSMAMIDEPLYVYRRRVSGSITTTGTLKNVTDSLGVIDVWLNRLSKESDNPNSEIVLKSLAKQYCNYIIGYSSLPADKKTFRRFKKLSFLLNYSKNKRVVIFRNIKRVVGLRGLILTLRFYKNLK